MYIPNPVPEGHTETLQLTVIPQVLAWYILYQHIYSTDIYSPNGWQHISNTKYNIFMPSTSRDVEAKHFCYSNYSKGFKLYKIDLTQQCLGSTSRWAQCRLGSTSWAQRRGLNVAWPQRPIVSRQVTPGQLPGGQVPGLALACPGSCLPWNLSGHQNM